MAAQDLGFAVGNQDAGHGAPPRREAVRTASMRSLISGCVAWSSVTAPAASGMAGGTATGRGEDHGEAAAGRLLGDESSVHGFGEPAGQSEAKADAAVVAAAADALEGLEHAVAVAGRDAGPAVGNPQLHPVVMAACGQQHLLAGGAVVHRVGHQVGEDPFEQDGVGEHVGKAVGKVNVDAVCLLPQLIEDAGNDFFDREGLGVDAQRARLQAAHIQQVGDQPVEPLQGVFGGGYQFGAFLIAPAAAGVGEAVDGGPGR